MGHEVSAASFHFKQEKFKKSSWNSGAYFCKLSTFEL